MMKTAWYVFGWLKYSEDEGYFEPIAVLGIAPDPCYVVPLVIVKALTVGRDTRTSEPPK